ncbi:hypothetical protein E3N88_32414 [Mikania micrantha]|uniref:Reverse transcriptase Ty1/copia-type domain-containing protein n=1 Tax=Mikania micrantha TaxID=192012 RepID=A0A5N6M8C4_9ASTR|nr:hypothetical protein E3N88_32414 [Mikania micrantha]
MNFTVYQIDVMTTFLYGDVKEEIFVSQPPGFADSHHPQHVYKLDKALYGLHQAPRAWYATLTEYIQSHGYVHGAIDQTLFRKQVDDELILAQIYVDDIIFGLNNDKLCKDFEQIMGKKFEMSSLGEMIFFLGLQTQYRSMIGSLMYLNASRPDIMFVALMEVVTLTENLYLEDANFWGTGSSHGNVKNNILSQLQLLKLNTLLHYLADLSLIEFMDGYGVSKPNGVSLQDFWCVD